MTSLIKIAEEWSSQHDMASVEAGCAIGHPLDIFPAIVPESLDLNALVQLHLGMSLGVKKMTGVMSFLCIPIGICQEIDVLPPSLGEVVSSLRSESEPPTLGIVSYHSQRLPFMGEEYKISGEWLRPIQIEISSGLKNFEYYRCFRDVEHIKNKWEYTRCIYLEAHRVS